MKKHTVEEAKDMIPVSNGRTSLVSVEVTGLKVGEALTITRADWPGKRPPYDVINRVAKKTGRTFIKGRSHDGKGWDVKRMS
jgi:hypothetical protein